MPLNVAIIGAGPGGLVAARYLRAHGFSCTIFEQSGDIGGQWNVHNFQSGIWPAMRTNTSRVLTCFSDLPHQPEIATYPTNQQILAYLKRYADHFSLMQDIRLRTSVEALECADQGYSVRSITSSGAAVTEKFDHVVVASGRFNKPSLPRIPGMETFSGPGGVLHASSYKDPESYRGLQVLVAGCAISALEIASDLAMIGASRVVSTYRRQRYVLPKLFAGVPTDHVVFTRYNALCAETAAPEVVAGNLKDLVIRANGSPEQYGALQPLHDLTHAGITLSQYFLPLVAEGRIHVKPWIRAIDRQLITFNDGTQEDFDAVIFATGYDLSLPFVSDALRQTLAIDSGHIDLFNFTFHPDLPGLAFMGMYDQSGPYFPVLELQARWLAYCWAGMVQLSAGESREGVARYRLRRDLPQKQSMDRLALLFARAAGVEPSPEEHPDLARALLFGPLSPVSFRLIGPDRLDNAADLIRKEAAAFGAITSAEFPPEEFSKLRALRTQALRTSTS